MTKILCLTSLVILISVLNTTHGGDLAADKKDYIVYMGALPKHEYSPLAHHESILQEILESGSPSESLVRSYGRSFNGFVAKLTDMERQKLVEMEGVVSVFPSEIIKLHTTRSWDFIGFPENVKRIHNVESDVIIGVIDTGIWPESKSFSDEGFSPPPKKWKGACKGGKNFTCNNKVIGARFYAAMKEGDSTRDTQGHGSHTASIAAGNQIEHASFYGIGQGNAKGAVPSARIAVYKPCWDFGCNNGDILAAYDDAISDGVDILSVSLGPDYAKEYYIDVLAIGAFHAMQKGILTSQSAGNDGPDLQTVVSVAPWILSVAASSIDRRIIDKVTLGDGTTYVGYDVNGFDMKGKKFPLIYGGDAALSSNDRESAGECQEGSLNRTLVEGKIVLCDKLSIGEELFDKKAAGVIMKHDKNADYSVAHPLPTSYLNAKNSERIKSYINSTRKPMASISKSKGLIDPDSPVVISFSGRGPNPITPEILKPDITAPGVEILAAWSSIAPPSGFQGDTRSVTYNIESGTSMSCPHVTGAAAYVKSFHPDWSPSSIKSALMTTAVPLNSKNNREGELAYGAGQIDPIQAVNPGLVYEALEVDYINFLCNIGYSTKQMERISGNGTSCPKTPEGSAEDLNYPSMTSKGPKASFTRIVTNVGAENSTYTATITAHPSLDVTVKPKVLSFESLNEKKSFNVMVSTKKGAKDKWLSASLVWSDGIHTVRSPIVVLLHVESPPA